MNPMNVMSRVTGDDAIEDLFGLPMIGVSRCMADEHRHGTVCVREDTGKDQHLNFIVDKPHKLIHPSGGALSYLFEQLKQMGFEVRSIQIDCGEKPQLYQPV